MSIERLASLDKTEYSDEISKLTSVASPYLYSSEENRELMCKLFSELIIEETSDFISSYSKKVEELTEEIDDKPWKKVDDTDLEETKLVLEGLKSDLESLPYEQNYQYYINNAVTLMDSQNDERFPELVELIQQSERLSEAYKKKTSAIETVNKKISTVDALIEDINSDKSRRELVEEIENLKEENKEEEEKHAREYGLLTVILYSTLNNLARQKIEFGQAILEKEEACTELEEKARKDKKQYEKTISELKKEKIKLQNKADTFEKKISESGDKIRKSVKKSSMFYAILGTALISIASTFGYMNQDQSITSQESSIIHNRDDHEETVNEQQEIHNSSDPVYIGKVRTRRETNPRREYTISEFMEFSNGWNNEKVRNYEITEIQVRGGTIRKIKLDINHNNSTIHGITDVYGLMSLRLPEGWYTPSEIAESYNPPNNQVDDQQNDSSRSTKRPNRRIPNNPYRRSDRGFRSDNPFD